MTNFFKLGTAPSKVLPKAVVAGYGTGNTLAWNIQLDTSSNITGSYFYTDGNELATEAMGMIQGELGPLLFVKRNDNHLWFYNTGKADDWQDLGTPPPANCEVDKSMGAYDYGGSPTVVVTGTDGNLWVTWLTDVGWQWQNLGKPSSPNVEIVESMGALYTKNGKHYVFVEGSDEKLWIISWTNNNDVEWESLNLPISDIDGQLTMKTSIGAVAGDSGTIPYVYILLNNGTILLVYRNKINGWDVWSMLTLRLANPEFKFTKGMGVVCLNENEIHVYVIDNYGYFWDSYIPNQGNTPTVGSMWRLIDNPTPDVNITESLGTTTINNPQRPLVAVLGSDGHPYAGTIDNDDFIWTRID